MKSKLLQCCARNLVVCSIVGPNVPFGCISNQTKTAVAINDKADVIFSGTDAPAALGTLCSIGSINKESNGKITADVTDLLQEFGLDEARIYINFFDLDRANIGWSRSTFAG